MKTIVITGASEGIGKALAIKFAKKDTNLILGARNEERLKQMESQLKLLCNDYSYFKLDVSDEKNIINFFKKIQNKYGKVDILINNAGIGYYGLIKDVDLKKSKKVFDVNFFGLVASCREILKNQLMNSGGKIVNIASEVSFRGMPTTSIYCASKAAVKSFSESLEVEVKNLGINILVIYPGYINTEFHKKANEFSNLQKPIKKGICVEGIANYIIKRVEKNNFENIPCKKGKILRLFNVFFPKLLNYLLSKKYNKKYL